MRVACVTTCRGRLPYLRETLPQNLADCRDAILVLLNYNDQDGLDTYVREQHGRDIADGRLVYYKTTQPPRFHMAHAKNQAHRCAMREGADILITLDADNFAGSGFVDHVRDKFRDSELAFLFPDFASLPPHGQRYNPENPHNLRRGFAGRMAIRTQDFLKVGGYNQIHEMWGAEDIDILSRLGRLKVKKDFLHRNFLNAIPHGPDVRFKEWPEAKQFENDMMLKKCDAAHDTVVNYGNIGCGVVYRNFGTEPIRIDPVPTRVFGVGLQRTGTTSLQHALQSFGYDVGHWKSGEWAKTIWQEMNRWGGSRTMEKDYALCDNPFPALYKKLDAGYPNSKFILTVRNEDQWIESVRKFWNAEYNPRRWTWDVDGFSHKMHGITYGRIDFHEQTFREVYRRHNREVREYFRDNLLVLNIEDPNAMKHLCDFLDRPFGNVGFPHSNRGRNEKIQARS
jgi:hypothetical protein